MATPVRQLLEATAPTPGAKLGIMPSADIDAWEGDVEELRGHEDSLTSDNDLCDRIFASKQEAFAAGYTLASTRATS